MEPTEIKIDDCNTIVLSRYPELGMISIALHYTHPRRKVMVRAAVGVTKVQCFALAEAMREEAEKLPVEATTEGQETAG